MNRIRQTNRNKPNKNFAISAATPGWPLFKHKIPMLLFILVATVVALLSFLKRLSLIPVLDLLTSFYLMTQLGVTNWMRFGIWLIAGLVIYWLYSRKASKLKGVTN